METSRSARRTSKEPRRREKPRQPRPDAKEGPPRRAFLRSGPLALPPHRAEDMARSPLTPAVNSTWLSIGRSSSDFFLGQRVVANCCIHGEHVRSNALNVQILRGDRLGRRDLVEASRSVRQRRQVSRRRDTFKRLLERRILVRLFVRLPPRQGTIICGTPLEGKQGRAGSERRSTRSRLCQVLCQEPDTDRRRNKQVSERLTGRKRRRTKTPDETSRFPRLPTGLVA